MSLVIKGGTVFLGEKFEKLDILVENGLIMGVGNSLKGDEILKAEGMLVAPGLIDPHVHLREPGDTYKEDFESGGRAAIAGGFTTVIDMPNNAKPTVTKERLDEKVRLAKKAPCDVLFHFGGTDDNFDEVKRADPRFMKLYLGQTTGALLLKDPASLERHFASFPKDRPITLHACDHSEDEEKNLAETYDTVANAVSLAKKYGRRIHLAHASTKKEITLAKRYSGCTVEVAPHHLFLSENDADKLGPLRRVYPPLRSEKKRILLWSALEMVDCIATDHAPHTIEDKEKGAAGFPGLETSLGLMLHGCRLGLIDKIWVLQRMSTRPAEIFGLEKKGRIAPGYIADIAIIDPDKEWEVQGSVQYTKCRWSPFDGMKLKGKVRTVLKSGKAVYENYEFV
ncbi:MAG TPA: dihydroorotase family protein [Candidatus Bilamarchaeum sp.]|nr:dihydroorotase family protein [Candidatus Bilamarchaeum sp.]